jgi:predicted ATPase
MQRTLDTRYKVPAMTIVAFTGGQGSGKTTLARATADHVTAGGPRVVLLEGISNRVVARGLPLGEGATDETIIAFAHEHLLRERMAPPADFILLDRCLLDLVAYAYIRGCSSLLIGLLEEITVSSCRAMAAVFYVPTSRESAGMASPNESATFRSRVASEIPNVARRLTVRLLKVPVNFAERLPFVLAHLRRPPSLGR